MTPILIFLIFVFQGVKSNEVVIEENGTTEITCTGDHPASIFWLRIRENGFAYIGTYSQSKKSSKSADENKFTVGANSLGVKNFHQDTDSGYYSCVSINNNELIFGSMFKLRGEKVPSTAKPKITTVQPTTSMTTVPVTCPQKEKNLVKIDVLVGCERHIFIPLAAGCGFLLLLLIFTIIYCNRIRTRRCPHHYKRQPRSRPAGHKTLPNPAYQ